MANSIIVRGNKAITKPDAAHQLTEQKLTQLERQIGKTYAEATRDIERTIAKYWAGLDKREAEQIRRLKAGQITQAQFRQWKINQVGRGERLEAMRDDLAERVYNVNVVANAYINDTTAGIYSLNRNYIGYTIEKYYPQAAFTIYDEQTVKRLVMAKPDVMPYYPKARAIRRGIDIDYGKKIITNTITSSILQGRTIKQIAGDLQSRLINMERDSAVRAARTAYTGAQNAGRLAGMEAAQKQGINIQKQWLSTSDARTRDSHAMIDGEIKDINKPFSNGLMYPADRDGAPAEVYNCRCTLLYVVDGKSVLNGGDIYNAPKLESWIKENATPISLTDAGKVLTAPTPKPAIIRGKPAIKAPKPVTTARKKVAEKFKYTPAASIDEAEKYISKYVNSKQFGALGVSYKGVSLDIANMVNKTIAEFYETFDIGKFGGIAAPAGNTKLGKMIDRATAAYSPIRNSFILNRKSMKDAKTAEKIFLKEKQALKDIHENPEKYDINKIPKAKRDVIERAKKSGRATIPDNVPEVITHELGHMIEKNCYASELWKDAEANMAEWADKLSGYAGYSKSEYIAESFAAYNKGMPIEPVLKKIFDSLRR